MGLDYITGVSHYNVLDGDWLEPYHIKFSSDWNQLMDVVTKIEEMGHGTSFKTHYCRINPIEGGYHEYIVQVNQSGFATVNLDEYPEGDSMNTWWTLRKQTYPYDTDDSPRMSKFEMIYICVVEFIKWHNNQLAYESI